MVVALGPGKFYGSSLPRPHIYTDVKLNHERVDPPLPILDSFLSWANDAHWSMGGLSFNRQRLQGRIEGNIKKLRKEKEKKIKENNSKENNVQDHQSSPSSVPPPSASMKRRRSLILSDDDTEEIEEVREEEKRDDAVESRVVRRRSVRTLCDDFDRVASDTVVNRVERKNPKGFSDRVGTESKGIESKNKNKKIDETGSVKLVDKLKGSLSKDKKQKGSSKINVSPKIRTSPRFSGLA